jgi:hypothetical protein
VNPSPSPCFYNQADLAGAGSFADVNPTVPTHALAVEGTGNWSPGLTLVPTTQHVTFTGMFGGQSGRCTLNCSAMGTGSPVFADTGSGTATCSGTTTIGFTCGVSYQRDLTRVEWLGSCTGTASGPLVGHFTIEPTSPAVPITSYRMEGRWRSADLTEI